MFAGDIDANCKKTYFANYKISEEQWHTDIHNFNAKPYRGKIDLFVGGAPCQAFSIVGDQRGFDDTRGTLFREFARVVKECQPKVFIFENVKGMLSHDKGRTWQVIRDTFENYCGYDIYFQVAVKSCKSRIKGLPVTYDKHIKPTIAHLKSKISSEMPDLTYSNQYKPEREGNAYILRLDKSKVFVRVRKSYCGCECEDIPIVKYDKK